MSGTAKLDLAGVTRGRFKSVSADMTVALTLSADGQIDSESVSGNISLKFDAAPAAEFDVRSFSGEIRNCFGPKPMNSEYGPGSQLHFTNGNGHARVQINTKSGDVRLCVKGNADGRAAALTVAQIGRVRVVLPYVY